MTILSALSLGNLQTLQHVLQEMEGEGVVNLADARKRVFDEFSRQQRGRRLTPLSRFAVQPAQLCPNCGEKMTLIDNADPESSEKITVIQCRKCRVSRILEPTR